MGTLFIIATPIGNLSDITFRAVEVLKTVDIIACEDTRHSRKLLETYNIQKQLISFHSYNEMKNIDRLISLLKDENHDIALISDGGTPCISDPGFRLVRKAHDSDIPVIPIPGVNAAITLLSVCGFSTSRFSFHGFLSNKGARRRNQLKQLVENKELLVFYESTHRIEKFLNDVSEIFIEKDIVIGRELTKKFETIYRGNTSSINVINDELKAKGEFTIVINNY